MACFHFLDKDNFKGSHSSLEKISGNRGVVAQYKVSRHDFLVVRSRVASKTSSANIWGSAGEIRSSRIVTERTGPKRGFQVRNPL